MDRLQYGYTHETTVEGSVVHKRYVGVGAIDRQSIERNCLKALHDDLPVPLFLEAEGLVTRMTRLAGVHGKELIETEAASMVMAALGSMLGRIHSIESSTLAIPGTDGYLVHGDYGPQNTLFSPSGEEVVGVLDWEWAHRGEPLEDLAWVEWTVRIHHPTQLKHLLVFYDTYGDRPMWHERQEAMLRRCRELKKKDPVDRGGSGRDAFWDECIRLAKSWQKFPGE